MVSPSNTIPSTFNSIPSVNIIGSNPTASALTPSANGSLTARLQQELHHLMMNSIDGITAFPETESTFTKWIGTITGPHGTPYEKLLFKVSMKIPAEYPFSAPEVKFKSPLFHPNINDKGDICLDILKETWSPSLNIQALLVSLQSLLGEPNTSSPLNMYAAELWETDMTQFKANVEYVYKFGKDIRGHRWEY